MRVKDAAKYAGVSPDFIRHLIAKNTLKAKKNGRVVSIDRVSLDQVFGADRV